MVRRLRSRNAWSEETAEGSISAAVRMGSSDPSCTVIDSMWKKYYISRESWQVLDFDVFVRRPVGHLMLAGVEPR